MRGAILRGFGYAVKVDLPVDPPIDSGTNSAEKERLYTFDEV